MRRREFVALLGGAAAAWPLAARAQQGERVGRIGGLMNTTANTEQQQSLVAFQQTLQRLGWTEGRNVQMDVRWAGGDAREIRRHAGEWSHWHPTSSWRPAMPGWCRCCRRRASYRSFSTTSPTRSAAASSRAWRGPGAMPPASEYSLSAKWLETLKEIMPSLTRVAVLRDAALASGIGQFAVIQPAPSPARGG